MILPGEAEWKRIDTGTASDRVFVLQFLQNTSRRFVFWMQSIKERELDEENARKVNECMSGTGVGAQAPAPAPAPAPEAPPSVGLSDLQAALAGLGQQGIITPVPDAPEAAAPAPTTQGPHIPGFAPPTTSQAAPGPDTVWG